MQSTRLFAIILLLFHSSVQLAALETGNEQKMRVKADGVQGVTGRCRLLILPIPGDPPNTSLTLFQCEVSFDNVEWRIVVDEIVDYFDPRESPIFQMPLLAIRGNQALLCVQRGYYTEFRDVDCSRSHSRTLKEWQQAVLASRERARIALLNAQKNAQKTGRTVEKDLGVKLIPVNKGPCQPHLREAYPGPEFQRCVHARLKRMNGSDTTSFGPDRFGHIIPTDVKWGPDGPSELHVFFGRSILYGGPVYSVRYLRDKPDAEWRVEYREVKNADDKSESPWLPLPELPKTNDPIPPIAP